MTRDLLSETVHVRRQWSNIFKMIKVNTIKVEFFIYLKYFSKVKLK